MAAASESEEETLRVREPAELLEQHKVLVADILQASSLHVGQAKEFLGRPIGALAAFVSVLPATRHDFYSRPGGLLLLALECALLTARKAQVWEFSGFGHIERRRVEAPRWRLACILAALLQDLHRVVSVCVVQGQDTTWMPLREPLAEFACRQPDHVLRLDWRKHDPGSGCSELAWNLPLAHRIVDDGILAFLYEGEPEVVGQFYSTLSGEAEHRPANVIRPLVVDARTRLIARHEATKPHRPGQQESTASPVREAISPAAPTVEQAAASRAAPNQPTEHTDARPESALNSLDYSTQLLVKEIRKVLARPRSSKGQIQLQSDGRLSVRSEWIRALGFDVAQVASRLAQSGWLDVARPLTADSVVDALLFNERISRSLVGAPSPIDLLGGMAGQGSTK